jgi:hypothetical protein
MKKNHSRDENHSAQSVKFVVVIALAVAIFGVMAMLIVDHGPWSRPKTQTTEITNDKTTREAARAAGANVTSTAPKPEIEPAAPGPKPAQPAEAVAPKL